MIQYSVITFMSFQFHRDFELGLMNNSIHSSTSLTQPFTIASDGIKHENMSYLYTHRIHHHYSYSSTPLTLCPEWRLGACQHGYISSTGRLLNAHTAYRRNIVWGMSHKHQSNLSLYYCRTPQREAHNRAGAAGACGVLV